MLKTNKLSKFVIIHMKKIVIIITVLLIAIVTMAYLYFAGVNIEHKNNDHSLYAVAESSSLIFSFENDESILDILKGQDLLQEVIGAEKFAEVLSLKNYLIKTPSAKPFFSRQNVYIGLNPGKDKSLNLLYSTQINNDHTFPQLLKVIQAAGVKVNLQNPVKIELPDSTVFYAGTKGNLIVLSAVSELVTAALKATTDKENKFAEFIKMNSRIAKNSLAEVYINFEKLPEILKQTMPGSLSGALSPLNQLPAYAALVYNFSKDKVLLTGTTVLNSPDSYYNLFLGSNSHKVTINTILPENTANYVTYTIDDYATYSRKLKKYFSTEKKDRAIEAGIKKAGDTFHIDMDQLFPKYFKDQMITFELNNMEKIGAINLSNGDKLEQLLIDLSTPYNEDIKRLKVNNLLYSYFGDAFENFRSPYYTITDNYLIFSNSAPGLQSYLQKYKSSKLLINDRDYSNTLNQLPASATINFYIDLENSDRIVLRNIYLPFFRHIYSSEGLRSYSSVSYQLSGDNGKFLSNFLMTKKLTDVQPDSLTILP